MKKYYIVQIPNETEPYFLRNDWRFVQVTERQLDWTIHLLNATKDVIDCKTYRNKLKDILK